MRNPVCGEILNSFIGAKNIPDALQMAIQNQNGNGIVQCNLSSMSPNTNSSTLSSSPTIDNFYPTSSSTASNDNISNSPSSSSTIISLSFHILLLVFLTLFMLI